MTETEQRKEIRGWTEEMAERLLRDAGIAAGMRVLDVGCAHGDFTLVVARIVGERGAVTGLDREVRLRSRVANTPHIGNMASSAWARKSS